MKVIKIMIAATEELHAEKLEFTSLIEHLNQVLKPRGIELKRVKWNPEQDGSIEEFKEELHDCEMYLNLYWRELAAKSEEELDTAYEQLKDGKNPRNLYVFFKEATDDLTESLREFKANFVTNYGHFFCKFENVDTMNLHFILQFEAYQNHLPSKENHIVDISEGKVKIGDVEIANFDKIPFAGLNKEYRRLQSEVSSLVQEIIHMQKLFKMDPDNDELLDKLSSQKILLKETQKEYNRYQEYLYNVALLLVRNCNEQATDRMLKARDLFEQGDAAGAAKMLSIDILRKEKDQSRQLWKAQHQRRILEVEEFYASAKYAMTNPDISFPERFKIACEAYDEAIDSAREIQYDEKKLATILFDYSFILENYNRYNMPCIDLNNIPSNISVLPDAKKSLLDAQKCYKKAIEINQWALKIYKRFVGEEPTIYLPNIANVLEDIALLQSYLNLTQDEITTYVELLETYLELRKYDSFVSMSDIARTLNNLAVLYEGDGNKEDAKYCYQEAKKIYELLALNDPDENSQVKWIEFALSNLENDPFDN